jgi:hypothetical protein
MEITARVLWTLIPGLGFGALYLLACSGALAELYRLTTSSPPSESTPTQERLLKVYLLIMVVSCVGRCAKRVFEKYYATLQVLSVVP